MTQQTLETLTQRLGTIERAQRRLKLAGLAMAAVLALGGLIGATVPDGQVIEARTFILKDRAGKVRAVLGVVGESGSPSLVFYDREANANVILHLGQDDAPGLWLYDKDRVRAELAAVGDRAFLQLFDKENKPRAVFQVEKDGSPSVGLYDHDRKLRASLGNPTPPAGGLE